MMVASSRRWKLPVTVREVDRRVLLVHVGVEVGLITCVWSRIGQAARHSTVLLLSNEVDDAEGRDREQVGDEATGRKRTKGTFSKDKATRLKMVLEKCVTLIPFTLSQCQCDSIGNVRINV